MGSPLEDVALALAYTREQKHKVPAVQTFNHFHK